MDQRWCTCCSGGGFLTAHCEVLDSCAFGSFLVATATLGAGFLFLIPLLLPASCTLRGFSDRCWSGYRSGSGSGFYKTTPFDDVAPSFAEAQLLGGCLRKRRRWPGSSASGAAFPTAPFGARLANVAFASFHLPQPR